MTDEVNLDRGAPDWFLPVKHEAFYWSQFLRGGRTFIDVGAHVGTWTLNLARSFNRVFAFEPDPRGVTALRKNLEIGGITNVEVVPKAVSNKSGRVALTLFPNPSTNTMMPLADCGRVDTPIGVHEVDAVCIDDFVAERKIFDLDFIKVDAEAAEMLVVQGGLETFRTQRPDFFIEMHGLFYTRLRKLLDFVECDVLDGGRAGLSLLKHRDSWPTFVMPNFRVFPHGTTPTVEDQRELRRQHGIIWDPPPGFLSEGG
jgi:FkbM family methyltransferase